MDPRRSERVSEVIREELDELITYELSDPRIQTSGIGEVAVSPDARHAHVRVLLVGDPETQKETLEALNSARGYIRRQLAQRLDLFRIPELHFVPAVQAELGSRLESILKRVRRGRPRDPQATDPKDSSQKDPAQ
ncbi:MAG TPA: 30S ribosome-binding factor RbfA [Bryobacteraceae bacterium]|nr:30S ribosome-binding factor RbfA [Bryobacteraceae bacterium]